MKCSSAKWDQTISFSFDPKAMAEFEYLLFLSLCSELPSLSTGFSPYQLSVPNFISGDNNHFRILLLHPIFLGWIAVIASSWLVLWILDMEDKLITLKVQEAWYNSGGEGKHYLHSLSLFSPFSYLVIYSFLQFPVCII